MSIRTTNVEPTRQAKRAFVAPPAEPLRIEQSRIKYDAPDKIYLYLKHFPSTGLSLRVGTNKAVHGLASGLVASGIAVDVWCEGEQENYVVAAEGYGIQCFATRARYRTLRLAPTLKAHLTSLRPGRDLMILNGMFHPSVYALSRKLKALGVRYIVAPHGPYHPSLFRKNPLLKWPYWYLLERSLLKHALALQQLDPRHEMWARRLGINVPVVATENGFQNQDVVANNELRWRTQGAVRVLFWGRMAIHTKGLDILLAGFACTARSYPIHLTLQGPDWAGELSALKQLIAAHGLTHFVTVLPPIFDVSATRVMLPYDIVCMPSRFEGFGLAALEAMLAARVLLISSSAGIAAHVERSRCGVLVDSTAQDVQQGFEFLLSMRDQWREMGLRGREYALRHLHWDRIARRTLVQYRRLLN